MKAIIKLNIGFEIVDITEWEWIPSIGENIDIDGVERKLIVTKLIHRVDKQGMLYQIDVIAV